MQNDDRRIQWNRVNKYFRASPAYSELEERLELLESSRSSFSFLSTSVQRHIVVTVFTLLIYIRIKQVPPPPQSPLSITYCIIVIMTNLVDSLFTSAIVVFLAKIATTIMNGMMLITISRKITSQVIIKLGWQQGSGVTSFRREARTARGGQRFNDGCCRKIMMMIWRWPWR